MLFKYSFSFCFFASLLFSAVACREDRHSGDKKKQTEPPADSDGEGQAQPQQPGITSEKIEDKGNLLECYKTSDNSEKYKNRCTLLPLNIPSAGLCTKFTVAYNFSCSRTDLNFAFAVGPNQIVLQHGDLKLEAYGSQDLSIVDRNPRLTHSATLPMECRLEIKESLAESVDPALCL